LDFLLEIEAMQLAVPNGPVERHPYLVCHSDSYVRKDFRKCSFFDNYSLFFNFSIWIVYFELRPSAYRPITYDSISLHGFDISDFSDLVILKPALFTTAPERNLGTTQQSTKQQNYSIKEFIQLTPHLPHPFHSVDPLHHAYSPNKLRMLLIACTSHSAHPILTRTF
jgi:hypothetical protein